MARTDPERTLNGPGVSFDLGVSLRAPDGRHLNYDNKFIWDKINSQKAEPHTDGEGKLNVFNSVLHKICEGEGPFRVRSGSVLDPFAMVRGTRSTVMVYGYGF